MHRNSSYTVVMGKQPSTNFLKELKSQFNMILSDKAVLRN